MKKKSNAARRLEGRKKLLGDEGKRKEQGKVERKFTATSNNLPANTTLNDNA